MRRQAIIAATCVVAGASLIAATSAREVVEQMKPYLDAGATRIILPYVAATHDVVGEMKSFIEYWSADTTGINL